MKFEIILESGLNFIGVLLQTLVALAAVCGLAYVIFRVILPKLQIVPTSGSMIRIVERVGIDTRRSLLIVEAAGKWLLISVSESGVQLVSELNEQEAKEAEAEVLMVREAQYQKIEELRSGFAAKLASVMGRKELKKMLTHIKTQITGQNSGFELKAKTRKRVLAVSRLFSLLLSVLCFAANALAQNATASPSPAASPKATPVPDVLNTGTANPVVLIIVIGALALAPFALIMLTSFVKISVVLSILRNALGTQQVPPNQVITGISLILTVFIMAPVVEKMYQEAGTEIIFTETSVAKILDVATKGREPLRLFLERHASIRDRNTFLELAKRMAIRNGTNPDEIQPTDFRILVPAFVTSQLSQAFMIGFFLFIPFLVIDMVVSNILQAMGMFMLSPTTISLPFKLLLFVMIDGWALLLRNLVLGYV